MDTTQKDRQLYGSITSASTSTSTSSTSTGNGNGHSNSGVELESLPLPMALKPLLKRLIALGKLESEVELISDDHILSVMFIVRIADAMHRVAYATFLTKSFVDELKQKLTVPYLDLEVEVSATRWSYLQGTIMTYHRISWDFDGYAMQALSKIALGVLQDNLTVEEAFQLINDTENESQFHGLEKAYRNFPGRIWLIPLLASTGATVYFGGTWADFGFAIVTGTVAGMIHYTCALNPQLAGVQDLLVSIVTAMISTAAVTLFPDSVCFPAQVLGSLFWFLYGISFVMSLYEMTEGLTTTGLVRFALAVLNSFILAFGVVIGVWFAAYGGEDRFEIIMQPCTDKRHTIDPHWLFILYPLVATGALMQMRVSMKYWAICLVTQLVAVGGQHLLSTVWGQPLFAANFFPAFMATITAHVMIQTANWFNLLDLEIPKMAYMLKKFNKQPSKLLQDFPVRDLSKYKHSSNGKGAGGGPPKIRFQDSGWAHTGMSTNGYIRNERFQYQRSDLWFCLIPALYLLVPGSSVWRIAFFSIVDAASPNNADVISIEALISGVFVIGIGQVIGVRLALAVLWAVHSLRMLKSGYGVRRTSSSEIEQPLVVGGGSESGSGIFDSNSSID
jgi:hypothetical protein